jgi:predicted small lipoprotein YifL
MTAFPGLAISSGGGAVALYDRQNLIRTMIVGMLVAGMALSACGRKGPLEPPPGASATDSGAEDSVEAKKAAKPDRPFVLDPLL